VFLNFKGVFAQYNRKTSLILLLMALDQSFPVLCLY